MMIEHAHFRVKNTPDVVCDPAWCCRYQGRGPGSYQLRIREKGTQDPRGQNLVCVELSVMCNELCDLVHFDTGLSDFRAVIRPVFKDLLDGLP
jgi:hypothetical protein